MADPVALAALARRALDVLEPAAGARIVLCGPVAAGPLAVAVTVEAVARGVDVSPLLGLDEADDALLDAGDLTVLRLVATPAGVAAQGGALRLVAPTDALAQAVGRATPRLVRELVDGTRPALLAAGEGWRLEPSPAIARGLPAGDVRLDRLARVVVERMTRARPRDRMLILGHEATLPLVERIARHGRAAGAEVATRLDVDGLARALLAADASALAEGDPVELAAWAGADILIKVHGASNLHDLDDVPIGQIAANARGRGALRTTQMTRGASGALRWAVTLCPCPALAQAAGLDLDAYAELVYAAAFADREDPVGAWEAQAERQAGLIETVSRASELRFVAPGTDVRLRVDGRTWRSSAANRNLPDGEVFTGPLEDSAEGFVEFTYPVFHEGRRVEGVRLVFAGGRVVEATARRGEDVLLAQLDQDDGARRLGEVGIGTNAGLDRFTGQILLDEKLGGSFHLAVGAGYPETGSTNRSGVHWDMICDLRGGGEILADGVPIQRAGVFLPASGYGRTT